MSAQKRTTMSVSNEHLDLVLSRIHEFDGAKMRVDASNNGIDIVANRAGWLTLAKWCLVLAHPELGDDEPPWHLDWDVLAESAKRGDLTFGFWALPAPDEDCFQGVNLWRRRDPNSLELANGLGLDSPYTQTAADGFMASLSSLSGASRTDVIERFGGPYEEHDDESGHAHLTFRVEQWEIDVWLDDAGCCVEGFRVQIARPEVG